MIQAISKTISMVFSEDGFTFSHAVLVNDQTRLMIDSGVGSILKQVDPGSVDILINSHCHLDHINGNDSFTRARIHAHPIEKGYMQDPERTTATKGWDDLMPTDRSNHVQELGGLNPRILEPWRVDEEISDGQVFDTGSTRIIVIHTPGHTAGHCSFYFPNEEFIFTGDICLSRVGPWYGDPEVNVDDFLTSAQRILDLKPRCVATGHVPHIITDNITEIFKEYIDRIYKREKRIHAYLKEEPMSIDALAAKKPIYRDHPSTFVLFWEKSMIKKHLDKLENDGQFYKIDEKCWYTRS